MTTKPMAFEPLSIPVPFSGDFGPVCVIRTHRQLAAELMGPPHLVDVDEGLGMTDFWAWQYPCGLQVLIQFCHLGAEIGVVRADLPEPEHVVRHLPFESTPMELATMDDLKLAFQKYMPNSEYEADDFTAFQVWRQGDDGNAFPIGDPTSERAARCRVAEFESHKHKQIYWVERIAS